MVACSALPEVNAIVEFVVQQGGQHECIIIGRRATTAVVHAAMANGGMAHGDEVDPVHMTSAGRHVAAGPVPTALTVGEWLNSSLPRFHAARAATREYLAFAVKADSALKTGKDLAAQLRRDPGSISIAVGTSLGGVNHAAAALIAKAAGADVKKLKTIVFKFSAESATALLGGHIDLVVSSASLVVPHAKAGRFRMHSGFRSIC